MARILVTGSRRWDDLPTMVEALNQAWIDLGKPAKPVLVHGACPYGGADRMAADLWTLWGWPVEAHPADWDRFGKAAGPKRNVEMVKLGADICLAFVHNDSRGTVHCANTAERAGILTRRFSPRRDMRDDVLAG